MNTKVTSMCVGEVTWKKGDPAEPIWNENNVIETKMHTEWSHKTAWTINYDVNMNFEEKKEKKKKWGYGSCGYSKGKIGSKMHALVTTSAWLIFSRRHLLNL